MAEKVELGPQEKQIKALRIAYKNVFSTEEGKVVLHDLLRHCNMMGACYRGDLDDAIFNEGMRNVALYILENTQSSIISLTERFAEIRKDREDGYFD